MSIIDNLINDDNEGFRNEIRTALFDKIKEKIQDKKIEMSNTLYDDPIDEEPEASE